VTWLWVLLLALVLAPLSYWALIVTEGAYLGRRVVTLLYDWTPRWYDRIKAVTWHEDHEWLVDPLLQRLEAVSHPLVLDVGTGTGRLPLALLSEGHFDGTVLGLDLSRGMLRRARARLESFGERCTLIWHDADDLPFADRTFDVVACLETLEFTPRPRHTLHELVRVLRPRGVLLISNRIGRARWFPGRTFDDDRMFDLLDDHPLRDAQIHNWNSFYDLVWARREE